MTTIQDRDGRPVKPSDPNYDKVRIDNLEDRVHELLYAVVDLRIACHDSTVSRCNGQRTPTSPSRPSRSTASPDDGS